MLTCLSVRNLAIVESADVEFGAGLNVITGETGAGKSVLMGALELVLGARADASTVRDGAKEARIEAEFQGEGSRLKVEGAGTIDDFLAEVGLPLCEDGVLIVRRTISATGGGRVHVNNAASTVQTLRALGKLLVDVHGPNDHQSLLEESFQRSVLDASGRIGAKDYATAWTTLSDLRAKLAELQGDSTDVAEECERLRYAVEELDAAKLTSEDDDELPARHAAAAHAAEILDCANAATAALSEADDSAAAALIGAGARVREMARFHEAAAEWGEEIERLTVQAQELSREISDSVSRLDADPETLEALDERLSLVQRLKRKYNCADVASLLALRDARAERLADLEGRDARLKSLADEIAAAEIVVRTAGAKLTAQRKKTAEKLAKQITKELHGLGFLKAGFGVTLTPHEPDASGCDTVDFQFAPNPGEPARPLREIASTGEIARVMLAVKTVVAEHDAIPVLVFDEIDSNIGGEVGRAVGEKLRAVARHHQVIAITHLPQSAVYGERHFAVAKSVSGGRTRSSIQLLEGEARVAEIARMLGGTKLTSVVEQHARELVALAAR